MCTFGMLSKAVLLKFPKNDCTKEKPNVRTLANTAKCRMSVISFFMIRIRGPMALWSIKCRRTLIQVKMIMISTEMLTLLFPLKNQSNGHFDD